MSTDLFLAAAGLGAAPLLDAVPPACRRPVLAPALSEMHGDAVLITLPECAPRCAAVHLLPSFSALTAAAVSFRFELSVRSSGAWSPWVAAATIGPAAFEPMDSTAAGLKADVDEFHATEPVTALRLRLRLRGEGGVPEAPWLISLSASDARPPVSAPASAAPRVQVSVPAISQVADGGDIAMRICSPTSLAMVLGYWGRPVTALAMAAESFHPALNLYGVWPAAIAAGARHGITGYLLRFPDWDAAAWCLRQGMPIIASVRYAAGELTNAPLPQTTGHLLVLTGYDGDWVLVNDPVAPDAASVPRRYPLRDLQRVWLERAAVGYVLFPPPR